VHNGAAFWPAAGVSVAALLSVPSRHWWMVLAAVLACESVTNLANGLSLAPSVSWGVANALEPLVGAALVRRALPTPALLPVRHLLVCLACAAGWLRPSVAR
jgi:integral membrane sensor domain MASE1